MTVSGSLQLSYALVSVPNPILASAAGANPSTIGLQVIVSNPTAGSITLEKFTIEIPTGEEVSADISTATSLPPPTYDTSIPWIITSNAETVTVAPSAGSTGVVNGPIVFTLPGIQVNETPGTVPITVTEFPPSPAPKVVDDTSYSLLKQPADFPVTSFSATPAIVTDLDQPVTLSWTCSDQGKQDVFGLRVETTPAPRAAGAAESVAHAAAPAVLTPPCAAAGDGSYYTWEQGAAGVRVSAVNETTTFILDVIKTDSNGHTTVIDSIPTTVQVLVPSVSQNSYAVPNRFGRIVRLHWLAFNATRCSILVDGTAVTDGAPVDTYRNGYPLGITAARGLHQISIVAHGAVGGANATLVLPDITVSAPDPTPVSNRPLMMALTPDGSLALVTSVDDYRLFAVNVKTGQVVGSPIQLPGGQGPLAITPDGSLALIAGVAVSILQLPALTVESATIPIGQDAQQVVMTPDGSLALTSNFVSNTVTVIDVAGRKAVATVTVNQGPFGMAITPDSKTAFVTSYSGRSITPIDLASRTALPPIPTGLEPRVVGISPDGTTGIAVNLGDNTVTLFDVAKRSPVATIGVGDEPGSVIFTPDGSLAFIGNGAESAVTVVDVAGRRVVATIRTGIGPWPVAISPDGLTALAGNGGSASVTVIDVPTLTATAVAIPVGNTPAHVAFTPDGQSAVVLNRYSNSVSLI